MTHVIQTRDCATIHLTTAIFEMAMELFLCHRRVLIKITFIQNQLQAVPMSKVFESQKRNKEKNPSTNKNKNTKLVSVMLFTTTRNKKTQFLLFFCDQKKISENPQ